jgi:hypothetical protein
MAFLKELFALFLLIVAITAIKPEIINDLYGNILGRIVLIAIILFFTTHNTTLGLLVALCLIAASNQFFGANKMGIEGYKNNSKKGLEGLEGLEDKEKEEKEEEVSPSINELKPKDSASIPVSKEVFRSTDVAPKEEGFTMPYSIII